MADFYSWYIKWYRESGTEDLDSQILPNRFISFIVIVLNKHKS